MFSFMQLQNAQQLLLKSSTVVTTECKHDHMSSKFGDAAEHAC